MVSKMNMTRKTILKAAAAALLVTTAGASTLVSGAAVAKSSSSNKELRIGTSQEFENLNPLIANMSATTYILSAVNRSELAIIDENNQWKPQAAERIPTVENGDVVLKDDGTMRVTWRVRKEAVWGDGKPISAKDYKLTWEIANSPKVSIPSREPFAMISKFEIDPKNSKVFTLQYTKQAWDYYKTAWQALPRHLEESVFKKFGNQVEGYDRNSKYTSDPKNVGLYSGPYRVEEIKLGSHISLVRNEKWWGPTKPTIEKVLMRLIPNTGTLESNLVSGNIDMIMSVGMTFDQAIEFEERVKKEKLPFNVEFVESQVFEHVDVNLDNPLLSDKRTRQAILYAIDRKALTEALFKGKQKVAAHFIHPTDPWFTDDKKTVNTYSYSPRKARRLLASVGFKKGKNGVLELNGKPFKITFMTTSGNKIRENVQVFIKNQLAQVGISVEIKNQPAKVFFGETTKKRKYEALAMYAWISSPESDPKQGYHSKSIPSEKNGWSGTNGMGWKNKTADKAIDTITTSFDLKDRQEQAKILLKEYTEELPSLPLYYRAQIVVSPKGFIGMKPTSHTFAETYHIEKWRYGTDRMSKK